MKSQAIKNSKYMAVTMYRRRERTKKLKSQLTTFFFCLGVLCTSLYLIIASMPK
jgi:hypothetical protein